MSASLVVHVIGREKSNDGFVLADERVRLPWSLHERVHRCHRDLLSGHKTARVWRQECIVGQRRNVRHQHATLYRHFYVERRRPREREQSKQRRRTERFELYDRSPFDSPCDRSCRRERRRCEQVGGVRGWTDAHVMPLMRDAIVEIGAGVRIAFVHHYTSFRTIHVFRLGVTVPL